MVNSTDYKKIILIITIFSLQYAALLSTKLFCFFKVSHAITALFGASSAFANLIQQNVSCIVIGSMQMKQIHQTEQCKTYV
jgi:hypothetical protein